MILLILVAALWICVLAPSAWRHHTERQGVGSIDHFHHQLELLEHAGPKLMSPAYSLHTALPHGGGDDPSGPVPIDPSRPRLVLVRPTEDEDAADVDGVDGCHYERVGVLEAPAEPFRPTETRAELLAYRRQQARLRCTLLLRGLTGVAIFTGFLGMVPALRPAWALTALSGFGALALVGLIAYANELETQLRTRRHARDRMPLDWSSLDSGGLSHSAAAAGYPGAWDQEDGIPQHAAL